jgi:hypothetical protein
MNTAVQSYKTREAIHTKLKAAMGHGVIVTMNGCERNVGDKNGAKAMLSEILESLYLLC